MEEGCAHYPHLRVIRHNQFKRTIIWSCAVGVTIIFDVKTVPSIPRVPVKGMQLFTLFPFDIVGNMQIEYKLVCKMSAIQMYSHNAQNRH